MFKYLCNLVNKQPQIFQAGIRIAHMRRLFDLPETVTQRYHVILRSILSSSMVWKPNATVAAVIEHNKSFLMVEELIDGQRVINQPAGHLENNESLVEAVIREVREETARVFHPLAVLGIYRWQHPVKQLTHMRTTFIGNVTDHEPDRVLDEPIIRAEWLTRDQLQAANLRSPLVLRCIDDYLSGLRYPLALLQNV